MKNPKMGLQGKNFQKKSLEKIVWNADLNNKSMDKFRFWDSNNMKTVSK